MARERASRTWRNLFSALAAVFLQQLLRRKSDSLLLSACLELARAMKAADIKAPWQHFSRQYNPVARLMGFLGAFVEAPPPLSRPQYAHHHLGAHQLPGFEGMGGGGGGVYGYRAYGDAGEPDYGGGGGASAAQQQQQLREDMYFGAGDGEEVGRVQLTGPLVGASGAWAGPVGGGASLLRGRDAGMLHADANSDFEFP